VPDVQLREHDQRAVAVQPREHDRRAVDVHHTATCKTSSTFHPAGTPARVVLRRDPAQVSVRD
jgi:hypothetical protein